MHPFPGDVETCLALDGSAAINEQRPLRNSNNSNTNFKDAMATRKTFGRRAVKFCKSHYLLFIVGVVVVVAIIKIVFLSSQKECVSEITEKYVKRLSVTFENKIDPCQDFNEYSCITRNPDSNETSFVSSTFSETEETLLLVIKSLLEDPRTNQEIASVRMAKQLYTDCVHNTSFSSYYQDWSWMPFYTDDNPIHTWPITEEQWSRGNHTLERILAQIFAHKQQSIFNLDVTEDEDSSIFLLAFSKAQPAIELFAANESSEILKDLHKFGVDLRKLVEASNCGEDKRDIWSGRETFEQITLDEIQIQIPQINWIVLVQHVFDLLELDHQTSQLLVQFSCFQFFHSLANLIEETGRRTVANYITQRFYSDILLKLDDGLHQSNLDSADSQAYEDKLRHLRWKNCASIVKDGFEVALAHLYLKTFPKRIAATEKIVQEMVDYLKMAFRQIISKQVWIPAEDNDQFKEELIEKLMQMKVRIGFPKFIKSSRLVNEYYDGLVLNETSFALNFLKIKKFQAQAEFAFVNETSDRDEESYFESLDVNAYFVNSMNEIEIPLGLLHYPMFDKDYPMYLNFANVGTTVAHEIAHGFDNPGLHYDKDGNFTSWWPQDAHTAFKNQAICFVEQYGKFKIPLVDTFVDGNITLEENISDNAAIPISLLAYEMWARDHNLQEQLLPGLNFTIPQIFYIAFGQAWCEDSSKFTSLRHPQETHSPDPLRVLGVLQNSENFGNIFGCPAGSPMNPTHKCLLWS